MAAPTKTQQETEARQRQEGGADPAADIAALDVLDADAGPGDPGGDRPGRIPADEPAPRAPTPVRSAADDKRSAIINRWKTGRTEEADAARDDISDFQRTGMPPEFEDLTQPQPVAATDAEPVAEPVADAEPAPARHKIKVNGQEIEMTVEELIAKAQIAVASDGMLDAAKTRLKQANDLYEQVTNKVQRGDQPGKHHAQPQAAQTTAEPAPDPAADDVDQNTNDDVNKLIEAMQFGGDPEETRSLLQNTIAKEVAKATEHAVTNRLQADALKDEGARSQKALADFLGQNADIANDPKARAVVEQNLLEQQLEDIKALGVDPNLLPTAHGGTPTPGDIAEAHRWYRANRWKVRTPQQMLETAVADFRAWKGVGKTTEPAADPAPAAPRVDLTVERGARRQAAPQQPTRTVAPNPSPATPPAARDRSSIVQEMKLRTKGFPRRGGANAPAA